jgi:mannose-6-phosphate isomerase-like protein (cupin superfamily)/glycerol-3-phosphate cytidylyltransferase-like family protein
VRLLQQAAGLGDRLVVIVNNDEQVRLKGSVPFMSEAERLEIVLAIGCVDEAIVSIDTDRTVCRSLESIGSFDIFAKGGDSTNENVPEREICQRAGAELKLGIGGGKIQSSSWLLRPAVQKPWGSYTVHDRGAHHWLKTLTIKAGEATSLQSHKNRREIWVCLEGSITALYDGRYETVMLPGDCLHIGPGDQHRISSEAGGKLAEVAIGDPDENDIVRHEDKYGRA